MIICTTEVDARPDAAQEVHLLGATHVRSYSLSEPKDTRTCVRGHSLPTRITTSWITALSFPYKSEKTLSISARERPKCKNKPLWPDARDLLTKS